MLHLIVFKMTLKNKAKEHNSIVIGRNKIQNILHRNVILVVLSLEKIEKLSHVLNVLNAGNTMNADHNALIKYDESWEVVNIPYGTIITDREPFDIDRKV